MKYNIGTSPYELNYINIAQEHNQSGAYRMSNNEVQKFSDFSTYYVGTNLSTLCNIITRVQIYML